MKQWICFFVVLWAVATTAYCQTQESKTATLSADEVVANFLKAVQTQVMPKAKELEYDGVLKECEKLGERLLKPHHKILHEKAKERIHHLTKLNFIDISKLKPAYPDKSKDLKQFAEFFLKKGYGVPPFSRHVQAWNWWDPIAAAKTLRDIMIVQTVSDQEYQQRQLFERLNTPRFFKLADATETPEIAILDGKEIFIVKLEYSDLGIYSLKSIQWLKVGK